MDEPPRISFLGAGCAKTFRRRIVILQPRDAIDFVASDWDATLVVVERGELEVECCSGTRAHFGDGAVLSFCGLTLRRLRNAGDGPLVLSALSRNRP
jgi:hypothetical protein